MEKLNFHYVAVLLDQLYGVEMEEEDLEEIGLVAWEAIGNKDTRLYRYRACIGRDNSITLPCNAQSVEAVTISHEDWNRSTNKTDFGDLDSAYIEDYIEGTKHFSNSYYMSGKLINYEQVGDILYFPRNYGTVNILYKGIVMDGDGLPFLTDKEAKAIATFLAYSQKYKEGLKTNNTVIINLAQNLEGKWLKYCDQARVTKLSQNDMNDILDVKNNWDRKSYGISYKPMH